MHQRTLRRLAGRSGAATHVAEAQIDAALATIQTGLDKHAEAVQAAHDLPLGAAAAAIAGLTR